jgi:hypothetical protein
MLAGTKKQSPVVMRSKTGKVVIAEAPEQSFLLCLNDRNALRDQAAFRRFDSQIINPLLDPTDDEFAHLICGNLGYPFACDGKLQFQIRDGLERGLALT